jgi:hypothetical protein
LRPDPQLDIFIEIPFLAALLYQWTYSAGRTITQSSLIMDGN